MKYTTVYDAIAFIKSYNAYVGVSPVNKTKLFIYCSKQANMLASSIEKHYENIEDDKIRHCFVDKDGFVVRDPKGNLQFTREGTLALSSSIRDRLKLSVKIDLSIDQEMVNACLDDNYKSLLQLFLDSCSDEPKTKLIQEEYVKS